MSCAKNILLSILFLCLGSEQAMARAQSYHVVPSSHVQKVKYNKTATTNLKTLSNNFKKGDEKLLAALIEQGADVNVKNAYGAYPLFMAVLAQSEEGVRLLLNAGANPDVSKPKTKGTALFFAAQNKNKGIVEALIAAKANVNLGNSRGLTPLFIANVKDANDIVALLLKAGADPNIRDAKKNTSPLYIAAERGNVVNIKALIAAKANVDDYTVTGATPLYIASAKGHSDAVKLLLEAGADRHIAVRDDNGLVQAPLVIADKNKHDNVVALLEKDLPKCSGQETYKGWGLLWMENYYSVGADLKAMNNNIDKKYKLRFIKTSKGNYSMDFNQGHSVHDETNKEQIFVDGKKIYEGRWQRKINGAKSFSYVMPKMEDSVIDQMSKGRQAELRIVANGSGEYLAKSVKFSLKDFSSALDRVKKKVDAIKTNKAEGRCRLSRGIFGLPF